MADRWETISRYKNMVDKEGLQIGQVKAQEKQKVKDRQKRNRETRKRKRLAGGKKLKVIPPLDKP